MVYRGMGQKNAEFVARAGRSLGGTLPTGFCLKTVVLVQLRRRPVNAWQGCILCRSSHTECFFPPSCLAVETASCKCGFRQ